MSEPPIKILHVEDNEANRYIVGRILRNAGFSVVEATTGEAGLNAVIEHRPDLVILDVKLPDLNGFEVCRQIKSNPATAFIPVLHLSASFVKSQDKAEGLDSGADAYLVQPVEPIELLATLRSLLRIRQAEEAAVSLAQEWQNTFDAINDGVGLLDPAGRFQRCNYAMTKLLGKATAEILGGCYHELMYATLGTGDGHCFERAKETRQRESIEVQSRGRWFSKTIDPVMNEQGILTGAVFILSDVTERKQAETSLRFLSETSSVLTHSLDYKTILINIAHLAVPTIADFCFFDLVIAEGTLQRAVWYHGDPTRRSWFEQVQHFVPSLAAQEHPTIKVLLTGQPSFIPNVSASWLQTAATSAEHLQFMQELNCCSLIAVPLIANGYRNLGVLTMGLLKTSNRHYELADLVLAEELARRTALALENAHLYREAQEANRLKDEFLAVLSHELRSPLNPILGWAKILQTSHQDEAKTKYALETIERNAKLQTQLIEDLLDVSRILQGKLNLNSSPIDLAFTIKAALETVHLAAEAKSIQIQTLFESIGNVLGDSGRLQQVVWNLLSNAIKFTPSGGQIAVKLEKVVGDVNITGNIQDDSTEYAQITVSDNGKGIHPNFLPHVFDYFRQADSTTTRRFGGLGLGLAIVRHLIEAHGGTVQASSPGEGRGATFRVKLPLIPTNSLSGQELTTTDTHSNDRLKGLRILLVDDDQDTREFITFLLEQYDIEVAVATSASEALDRLEQVQPNLLISDIGMPDMDGYMLVRQIRTRSADQGGQIPAIALTAYAGESNQKQALLAGFNRHLSKPIEPDVLIQTIASLVEI